MVFNVFVMMQLFNFINSRKIHEEINPLAGILTNKLFIVIVCSILVLQALLVTFGGSAVHVYSNFGLTIEHWLICLGVGFLGVPLNFFLKQIHLKEDS